MFLQYITLSFIVSPVYGTLLYGTLNGKNNNLLYDRIHKHSGLRNSKKFFTENRQRINALPREIFGWLPKSIRRHWWSVNLQISSNFPIVMAKQWVYALLFPPKKMWYISGPLGSCPTCRLRSWKPTYKFACFSRDRQRGIRSNWWQKSNAWSWKSKRRLFVEHVSLICFHVEKNVSLTVEVDKKTPFQNRP